MFHTFFQFWDNSKEWHGELMFECFAESIAQAGNLFEATKGFHPIKKPTVSCQPHFHQKITAGEVLLKCGLFNSKSEINRAIKAKCVKINWVVVDSVDELIENGDFLNFLFSLRPQALEFAKEHGRRILVIHNGKKIASIIRLNVDKTVDILVI